MPPCQVFVLCEFQSSLISGTHSTGKLSAMCFKLACPSDVRHSNSIWACFHCARLAEDEARGHSRLPLMPRTGKTPAPGGTASLWSLLDVSSTPNLAQPNSEVHFLSAFPQQHNKLRLSEHNCFLRPTNDGRMMLVRFCRPSKSEFVTNSMQGGWDITYANWSLSLYNSYIIHITPYCSDVARFIISDSYSESQI